MPREDYDYLTDATEAVLDGCVKAVAAGWDKCYQFVSDIARGERRDPYAYFRSMYEGTLRGKASTAAWDNDMARLRAKHAKRPDDTPDVTHTLTDKITYDAQTTRLLIEAARDGQIDADEVTGIRKSMADERHNMDELDRMLDAIEEGPQK